MIKYKQTVDPWRRYHKLQSPQKVYSDVEDEHVGRIELTWHPQAQLDAPPPSPVGC